MFQSAATASIHLSDHDLEQLDEERLAALSAKQLQAVSVKLLADLKEARERLKENPSNSSCPASSRAPWEAAAGAPEVEDTEEDIVGEAPGDQEGDEEPADAHTEPS